MGKRRPTVSGGRRVDPDTGQIDGHDHRDHGNGRRDRTHWEEEHTADKTRRSRETDAWWLRLAREMGWGHGNRGKSYERRNP